MITTSVERKTVSSQKTIAVPVGASLLAMGVNDNAGSLAHRGELRFFASKLAPTGGACCYRMRTRNERPLILPSFKRCKACLATPRSTAT
ncbi:hypothetical protein PSJE_17550 [Pseudomonas jessenii]|nr:hypothetical protein PSJE_17550 [Pseudomonas jessenii]